ncbi:MAG: hypothetical protein MJH10_10385 [Epibacterium sp.]|nr:hypothetical protein [Epibacterium sp.]NQX73947.1 hypothetical protein [Epibacterium sp.]
MTGPVHPREAQRRIACAPHGEKRKRQRQAVAGVASALQSAPPELADAQAMHALEVYAQHRESGEPSARATLLTIQSTGYDARAVRALVADYEHISGDY